MYSSDIADIRARLTSIEASQDKASVLRQVQAIKKNLRLFEKRLAKLP